VNEVTVFRLFSSKRALYVEVLEEKLGSDVLAWLEPALQSSHGQEKVIQALAESLESKFDSAFVRLLLFGVLEQPSLIRKRIRRYMLEFYTLLRKDIERGLQQDMMALEPQSAARAVVGMILHQQIFAELLRGKEPATLPQSTAPASDVSCIKEHPELKKPRQPRVMASA
jgi:AcrR family transcriptional regulator